MKRFSATILAALLLISAAITSGCAAKPQAQLFTCMNLETMPKQFTPYCADAGQTLTKLKWSYWGSDYASATGVAMTNLCDPNCAAGKTDLTDVDVTVDTPLTVNGKPVFSRLVLKYHSKVAGHALLEKLALATAPMH